MSAMDSAGSRFQSPVPRPRVFPPDVSSIPLSPSRLESPMFRERVQTLMQQGDFYAKCLDMERRRSHELDGCVARARELQLAARKRLCSATNAQASSATSDVKSLRTLENRLDKVLTRYNEVRNVNKKLRDDIQSLRREKVQQQGVQDKLEKETVAKQSEIAKLAAATQSAFDARDRANRQIEAMRAQVQEDDDDFEAGLHEQKIVLDLDRANIRDMPRLRTPKSPCMRTVMPAMRSSAVGSPSTLHPLGVSLLSTPDVKLRDETMKNVWLLNEKESDLRRQSERLKTAEDGLTKIKKKTGVQDAHALALALLAAEEQNFSMFNVINELSTEMEAMEVENNELAQRMAAVKGAGAGASGGGGTTSDAYRAQLKQELEDQITKSKQKVAFFEQRQAASADAMDVMRTGALTIYHKIGQTDEAFAQQVGSHGVTEANMLKLLGVIEQRIGELVDIHNIATNAHGVLTPTIAVKPETASEVVHPSKAARDKKHLHTSGGGGVGGGMLLRPTPPSADDFEHSDSDDGDDGVRPCKIAELHDKTASLVVGRRKETKPMRPVKK